MSLRRTPRAIYRGADSSYPGSGSRVIHVTAIEAAVLAYMAVRKRGSLLLRFRNGNTLTCKWFIKK